MPRIAEDELTDAERLVWHKIAEYMHRERRAPSHKELLIAVDNPSESGINRHLNRLREKGFLDWIERSPRSLRLHKWPDGKRARL